MLKKGLDKRKNWYGSVNRLQIYLSCVLSMLVPNALGARNM